MKKKALALLLLLASFTIAASAQSWETIENSGQYIWGMGYGTTVAEADRNAMADLISKIATHVQSDFQQEEGEMTVNGKTDQGSYVRSRVQTYSQATLTNAERLVLKNEPDAQVGRYMKKTENYKTAYALKCLDYINTIFDDDAVIIVANVAKRSQGMLTDGKRYQDNLMQN